MIPTHIEGTGQAQQHLTDAHQKKEVSLRVGRLRMRGSSGGSRFFQERQRGIQLFPDRWGEQTKELRIEFLLVDPMIQYIV